MDLSTQFPEESCCMWGISKSAYVRHSRTQLPTFLPSQCLTKAHGAGIQESKRHCRMILGGLHRQLCADSTVG